MQRVKRYRNFIGLVLFFIVYSIKGALAVAKLVLRRDLRLNPLLHTIELRTPTSFSTSMLVNLYSLMPGSLSMQLQGKTLTLHILDASLLDAALLESLHQKIVALSCKEANDVA